MKKPTHICIFGIYNPEYTRNRVLKVALETQGITYTECVVDPKEAANLGKYYLLWKKAKALKKREEFSHIVVFFPGHSVVWLARLIFLRHIIIWDAFVSIFNAKFDRGLYTKFTPRAWKDMGLDFISGKCANIILFDTIEHARYFSKTYFVRWKKFISLPISTDTKVFYPRPYEKQENFTLHFHGGFITLQGLEYVVEAADILRDENIQFSLIGGGDLFTKIEKMVKERKLENVVTLHGRIKFEEVPTYVARADVCLGIFGDTPKTRRVIATKVYEYAAMGKPILSARTKAMEEYFTDRENVLYTNIADTKDLAGKILLLKKDAQLREKIGEGARRLFEEKFTSDAIGKKFITELEQK